MGSVPRNPVQQYRKKMPPVGVVDLPIYSSSSVAFLGLWPSFAEFSLLSLAPARQLACSHSLSRSPQKVLLARSPQKVLKKGSASAHRRFHLLEEIRKNAEISVLACSPCRSSTAAVPP